MDTSTESLQNEEEEKVPNPNPDSSSDLPPNCETRSAGESSDASSEMGDDEDWSRRELPEGFSDNLVRLECESVSGEGNCVVYVVGTAHVSKESCKEVQAIVDYLKPQVVFLELCSNRVSMLTPKELKVPTMAEMIETWKKDKISPFGIAYSWFLAKVADQLEVLPGSEFRVAYEEAIKYGAKVILGDRPVHITLKRTWGRMSLWHKVKFLCYIFGQSIFLPSAEDLKKMLRDMEDGDMLTLVIQQMSKTFPTIMETLVHERDIFMSTQLLSVARQHSSVVAVVGKGHLSGIRKHWKQPVELTHLMDVPPSHSGLSMRKVLGSLGVTAGVAVAYGSYSLLKK